MQLSQNYYVEQEILDKRYLLQTTIFKLLTEKHLAMTQ